MKKKIEWLLNREIGAISINSISILRRWQFDPVTRQRVDHLELDFNTLNDARIFGGYYEIKARNPEAIIEEICYRTETYMRSRAEALISDIRAGYAH